MLSINTNIGAMIAANQLNSVNKTYEDLQLQATTGKRINSAKDDAAGLAIHMGMNKEFRGNEAAMKNINNGKDLLSTQEKSLNVVNDMFVRLKELAVSASDGSISGDQRGIINQEAQDIMLEIQRSSENAKYNGINILDGSNATIQLQVGAGTDDSDKITLNMFNASLDEFDIDGGDLSSVANAQTFIDNLDADMGKLGNAFARIGAYENRLDFANKNLVSQNESLEKSMSTISDADMAKVSKELAKNETLMQLGYSMLSRSNAQPGQYLSLFR